MPHMNGAEPKIEIFKPFAEAFELMKRILFQPFDVKKWFVIGLAAWLANLSGGGGFNYQYDRDVSSLVTTCEHASICSSGVVSSAGAALITACRAAHLPRFDVSV
jgi:hypothetical protein